MHSSLDQWIAGGRYRSEYLLVTCNNCKGYTHVIAETEYGATYWTPEECPHCGDFFDENTAWEVSDPKEDLYGWYRK